MFALGFVFFFELGFGVVAWLYLAEVMTNSGMSAAVVTNQLLTLLISLSSKWLLKEMDGWAFVMFGGITLLVSIK